MKTVETTIKFTVPSDSPVESERGQEKKLSYSFSQAENDDEALAIIKDKEWTIADLVNGQLKSNARSNAYQAELSKHKKSDVKAEDIVERMVRDYIRLGVPEDVARKTVAGVLGATA